MRRVLVRAGGLAYPLWVPEGDHVGETIASSGRPYEHRLLRLLRRLLKEDDVVVDVGANIGNHSLFLALVANARVHAFEPNPVSAAYLRRNVEENGCGGRVTIHECALGETAGRGRLEARLEHNLGAVSVGTGSGGDVAIARLDDVLSGQRVRLVKVDVEGAEAAVLRGASSLLVDSRPYVAVEAHGPREQGAIDAVLAPLAYRRLPVSFCWTPTFIHAPTRTQLARIALAPEVAAEILERARGRLRKWMARSAARA